MIPSSPSNRRGSGTSKRRQARSRLTGRCRSSTSRSPCRRPPARPRAATRTPTARPPRTWRPFSGQELPLAEYARQLIERFDFDVRVSDAASGDGLRKAAGNYRDRSRFHPFEAGRAALAAVASTLPRWVLAAGGRRAGRRADAAKLAARVIDILPTAAALPAEWSGRAARGVKSLDEFVSLVPVLVAEAERQYFRHRSSRAPMPGRLDGPAWAEPKGRMQPDCGARSVRSAKCLM